MKSKSRGVHRRRVETFASGARQGTFDPRSVRRRRPGCAVSRFARRPRRIRPQPMAERPSKVRVEDFAGRVTRDGPDRGRVPARARGGHAAAGCGRGGARVSSIAGCPGHAGGACREDGLRADPRAAHGRGIVTRGGHERARRRSTTSRSRGSGDQRGRRGLPGGRHLRMAAETAAEMNGVTRRAAREGLGLGEALGEALDARRPLPKGEPFCHGAPSRTACHRARGDRHRHPATSIQRRRGPSVRAPSGTFASWPAAGGFAGVSRSTSGPRSCCRKCSSRPSPWPRTSGRISPDHHGLLRLPSPLPPQGQRPGPADAAAEGSGWSWWGTTNCCCPSSPPLSCGPGRHGGRRPPEGQARVPLTGRGGPVSSFRALTVSRLEEVLPRAVDMSLWCPRREMHGGGRLGVLGGTCRPEVAPPPPGLSLWAPSGPVVPARGFRARAANPPPASGSRFRGR